jgi:hypothetical protein
MGTETGRTRARAGQKMRLSPRKTMQSHGHTEESVRSTQGCKSRLSHCPPPLRPPRAPHNVLQIQRTTIQYSQRNRQTHTRVLLVRRYSKNWLRMHKEKNCANPHTRCHCHRSGHCIVPEHHTGYYRFMVGDNVCPYKGDHRSKTISGEHA